MKKPIIFLCFLMPLFAIGQNKVQSIIGKQYYFSSAAWAKALTTGTYNPDKVWTATDTAYAVSHKAEVEKFVLFVSTEGDSLKFSHALVNNEFDGATALTPGEYSEFLATNDKATAAKLLRGHLWLGMDTAQFIYAKGAPDERHNKRTKGKKREEWVYTDTNALASEEHYRFYDGKLSGIQD